MAKLVFLKSHEDCLCYAVETQLGNKTVRIIYDNSTEVGYEISRYAVEQQLVFEAHKMKSVMGTKLMPQIILQSREPYTGVSWPRGAGRAMAPRNSSQYVRFSEIFGICCW